MKKLAALLGAALFASTAFAPAPAPLSAPEPDEDGFVKLSDEFETDDDWGGGGDNATIGETLGQELTGAYIRLADDVYTFRIELASLPAVGGTPEFTRYGWSFTYNGAAFELDGKFTNYSRGTCDPTSGQCPPPRDPGLAPFLLRGNCVTEGNLTTCEELARVSAEFDAANATIDIPLPAELLAGEAGIQECDRIAGSGSFIGEPLWAAPTAFFTFSSFPYDGVFIEHDFVVPPADETVDCDAAAA